MGLEEIRKQFPILTRQVNGKQLVYLDNAATTQKPEAVINAISEFYLQSNSNVHRGFHTLSEEATQKYTAAHEKAAKFINTSGIEEIVFTRNATEAINLVAQSVGRQLLVSGDVVVLTEMEHHSNIVPWQLLAKEKGITIEWIGVKDDFQLDEENLRFILGRYGDRVKLLSVVDVSNVLGVRNNVKQLISIAQQAGAATLVDCAQSVSRFKIDVKEWGCDFLVFSGHKLFGPTGTGVLYARKQWLEKLEPWMGGGEMVVSVNKASAIWADSPWKFEAGTPNIAGGIGLGAAIDWVDRNIDFSEHAVNEKDLIDIALKGLSQISGISILGPTDSTERFGVVAFSVDKVHPHDIASFLDEDGIAIRAGYHCAEPVHKRFGFGSTARISFALYNTKQEVEAFLDSLSRCIKKFR